VVARDRAVSAALLAESVGFNFDRIAQSIIQSAEVRNPSRNSSAIEPDTTRTIDGEPSEAPIVSPWAACSEETRTSVALPRHLLFGLLYPADLQKFRFYVLVCPSERRLLQLCHGPVSRNLLRRYLSIFLSVRSLADGSLGLGKVRPIDGTPAHVGFARRARRSQHAWCRLH
jgi:hypothetical protein